MLFTNSYIDQIKSCTRVKLALASEAMVTRQYYGSYSAEATAQHVMLLRLFLFVLDNWVNVDGLYNRVTESELSNVIEEVLRMPYDCSMPVAAVVAPANQPPTAEAGANQSLSSTTTSTTLAGSGSDPEGGPLTYQWTKVSGGNVTINSPTSAVTSLTNMQPGTYVFRLTVTDNQGATASDTVTVTIASALDTIWWGRSDTPLPDDDLDEFIMEGTSFSANGAQDVNVPWQTGASLPQYCWVAIPNNSSSHNKNKWFVDILNNGNIGGETDLFGAPVTVQVGSTEYLLWVSAYQTQFSAVCQFKKV